LFKVGHDENQNINVVFSAKGKILLINGMIAVHHSRKLK